MIEMTEPLELKSYMAFPEPDYPPMTRNAHWMSSMEVEELVLDYVAENPSPENKVMAFDLLQKMKSKARGY
jgi:hypothetical protein